MCNKEEEDVDGDVEAFDIICFAGRVLCCVCVCIDGVYERMVL